MRVEKPAGKILFKEEQQFRQWWFWLIIIGVFVLILAGIFVGLNAGERRNPKHERLMFVLSLLVPLGNLLVFYMLRLDTVITDEGIYYRWAPFRKAYKEIRWNALHKIRVKEERYKGLGSKYQLGYGYTHKVAGPYGVEMEITGTRVWLGTQRLDAFLYALEKAGVPIVQKNK
ncbi:MAG: hypothetical protein ACTHMC_14935 [Pseudobacter sp.]|uniref:hypothetical protein n=1 Tax=Pseudobacter sp. TaxID=2045420 RepID=UPI003F80B396